jgi:hypothetical protein
MEPSEMRALLLAQHDRLRELLSAAQREAEHVLRGCATTALQPILLELRRAFSTHNASEEALLMPILRRDPAWGGPRVERMLEEHTGEHVAFGAALTGSDLEVAARMADLVEDVDAHMAAEERTFLHPGVLRDDAKLDAR